VDIAVDLRKGSNPQSEIILEIPRGDTITVLKPVEAGVWLANYRGHTGYIVTKTRERDAPQKALSHKPNPKEFRQRSLEYLKEHHPEAAQKVKSRLAQLRKQYPLTITLRKGVIIYAKPQTDVIAALSLRGDQLKLIKHAGDGYIRVSYQGKIGYVWVLDLQLK